MRIIEKKEPSLSFIANFLITPSYLSVEYALGSYDLIPEKVTTKAQRPDPNQPQKKLDKIEKTYYNV